MFFKFLITIFLSSLAIAQTTSYNAEQWSKASSQALQTDGELFYAFLSDFNYNFPKYKTFMDENKMTYPANLQNYAFQIQSITDDEEMIQVLKSKSFPFSEFNTMFTKFEWASSLLSENGLSKVLMPSEFLTKEASITGGSESESGSGSGSSIASITSNSESSSESSGSESSNESSGSSSSSSEGSSSSSSTSASQSSNLGESLYIPIISFPLVMISFFLL
ncbi:Cell wall protein [Wickerhamomyces ciferrii]|uniref:Cell wall protein n=1 Tax=Wickerhamomyces ciferrii (strain ATCC 14091 / BCRC 22168 / CBS 111 / JCM 3599 / NBRC 0793 / NRRL Y-1031 F-60-10) TaxID=1206466 RepID=K0KPX0_WICCF|nr:Cell wall protein [Wickerhamomyces ciferrii]CCH43474.1 Cell wall protein [Wickerhamomyces ciferrii]